MFIKIDSADHLNTYISPKYFSIGARFWPKNNLWSWTEPWHCYWGKRPVHHTPIHDFLIFTRPSFNCSNPCLNILAQFPSLFPSKFNFSNVNWSVSSVTMRLFHSKPLPEKRYRHFGTYRCSLLLTPLPAYSESYCLAKYHEEILLLEQFSWPPQTSNASIFINK